MQHNWDQRAVFYDDGRFDTKQQFLAFTGRGGVRTKNYIGTIAFAGEQLNIYPKMFRTEAEDQETEDLTQRHLMKNLIRWLEYCNRVSYPFINISTELSEAEDLRELFITLYVGYVRAAIERGLYYQYVEETEDISHIKGKFDYTLKDTFMGFHCGNTASGKLAFCEMKYQMIMARALPIEVTQGTLEGDIKPGSITFYRLQSTADNKLRAYIAQGEVLPVATRSFGAIGIFAIPEMGRFYRHVLIEGNYPHHGAVAFGHFGKTLYEVFKYIGVPVEEIGYNQPAGVRYPTENPFA